MSQVLILAAESDYHVLEKGQTTDIGGAAVKRRASQRHRPCAPRLLRNCRIFAAFCMVRPPLLERQCSSLLPLQKWKSLGRNQQQAYDGVVTNEVHAAIPTVATSPKFAYLKGSFALAEVIESTRAGGATSPASWSPFRPT
eukprot:CAMPEP_0184736016 /NCGR_PEP_ID=MMETSP0314-20130426/62191_1 /TAXON_ID=38298 /ORGANISM="Rhodella maculata, Strain CCMP 736" /LENGTH=140 /DNA_ID=CAMNT_0027203075 /DNA_START=777 /DNA_END=1199 /DNA_ORIENTATION=+